MSQLKESIKPTSNGRSFISLCRLEVERLQEKGWQEPYEPRGSRTDLWERGGEIPPRHPTRKFEVFQCFIW